MYLKKILFTASILPPLALAVPNALAGEHHHHHDHEQRQHGAHVHGIAALNLALEGKEVQVELESPAANIAGFEHAPASKADHAALDKAVAVLKDGDHLFRFNSEAGCRMEKAQVSSSLLVEEDDEHHMHGHDGHGHKHEHEEHGHEGHEGETHSDIEAVYHFECAKPGKLTQLSIELFEAFPATEKLNVQYVIESKQGATELTAADHVVKF